LRDLSRKNPSQKKKGRWSESRSGREFKPQYGKKKEKSSRPGAIINMALPLPVIGL
jgi:hypothetical protein